MWPLRKKPTASKRPRVQVELSLPKAPPKKLKLLMKKVKHRATRHLRMQNRPNLNQTTKNKTNQSHSNLAALSSGGSY